MSRALARAGSSSASAGAGAGAPTGVAYRYLSSTSVSKRARRNAASPVSVEANFEVPDEQRRILQPLTTLTLHIVYAELVRRRLWSGRFGSGKGRVRSLATRHLAEPATDGWNCVDGAVALARAWALQSTEIPDELPAHFELPLATRLRLAVCLSVSWKFQRSNRSSFPQRFDAADSEPHTHELANVGYMFMTREDQEAFGGWSDENVDAIRGLYDQMIALEVDLLVRVNVFSLLTGTLQVQAEERAAGLVERGVVDADCAMSSRALVPFFIGCATGAPTLSSGGLVCAALIALRAGGHPQASLVVSEELLRAEFSAQERDVAWGLLHSAATPNTMGECIVSVGCYNDPAWEHHGYVAPANLRRALALAFVATE
jgi:hypothetical protein